MQLDKYYSKWMQKKEEKVQTYILQDYLTNLYSIFKCDNLTLNNHLHRSADQSQSIFFRQYFKEKCMLMHKASKTTALLINNKKKKKKKKKKMKNAVLYMPLNPDKIVMDILKQDVLKEKLWNMVKNVSRQGLIEE